MITFIATSYKEKYDPYLFISSLLLQTVSDWKCIIYCDGINNDVINAVNHFNDNRFVIHTSPQPTGYWGHYNRKHALENLVDTEFLIQTSIQDYYLPKTVEEINKFTKTHDFIFFDSIHNHTNYNVFISEPIIGKIDWGSFAIRTNIAKKIGINNPKSNVCDGEFVENAFKIRELRRMKIKKILTIHN